MNYIYVIPVLLSGLLLITLIATVGAIASRKFNFPYTWLSILSAIIYIYTGYLIAAQFGLLMAIIVANLLGLYDATIGMKLCVACKANFKVIDGKVELPSERQSVATMMVVATVFAFLGYFFV